MEERVLICDSKLDMIQLTNFFYLSPLLTTSDRAHACVSTLSCPDTVRQHLLPKKSLEKSTCPFLSTGMSATLASSGYRRKEERRKWNKVKKRKGNKSKRKAKKK